RMRWILDPLHHHESLTVGGHVVVGHDAPITVLISPLEERVRPSSGKRQAGPYIGGNHGVAISKEPLVSISRPEGFPTAVGRDLHFLSGPGKRPNVDFVSSRFVGNVCEPPPVRRKDGSALEKLRREKRVRLVGLIDRDP